MTCEMRRLLNILEDEQLPPPDFDNVRYPELQVFYDVFPRKYADGLTQEFIDRNRGGFGIKYQGRDTPILDHFTAIGFYMSENPSAAEDPNFRRGVIELATEYPHDTIGNQWIVRVALAAARSFAEFQKLFSSDNFMNTLKNVSEDLHLDQIMSDMNSVWRTMFIRLLKQNYNGWGAKFSEIFQYDDDESARSLDQFRDLPQ